MVSGRASRSGKERPFTWCSYRTCSGSHSFQLRRPSLVPRHVEHRLLVLLCPSNPKRCNLSPEVHHSGRRSRGLGVKKMLRNRE